MNNRFIIENIFKKSIAHKMIEINFRMKYTYNTDNNMQISYNYLIN